MNKRPVAFIILFLIAASCGEANKNNSLTKEEKEQGWTLLFDGESAKGWHLYNKKILRPDGS